MGLIHYTIFAVIYDTHSDAFSYARVLTWTEKQWSGEWGSNPQFAFSDIKVLTWTEKLEWGMGFKPKIVPSVVHCDVHLARNYLSYSGSGL